MNKEIFLLTASEFPPLGSKHVEVKENTQSHENRVPLTPKKTRFSSPNGHGCGLYYDDNKKTYQVSPYKIKNGFQLYFSQNSVSSKTSENVELNNLANLMNKSGWPKNMPIIRAAMIDGKIVVYDHRRLVAAIAAGIRVPIDISKDYEQMIHERMESNGLKNPRAMIPVVSSNQDIFTGANKERFDRASEHLSKTKVNLLDFITKKPHSNRKLMFFSGQSSASPTKASENTTLVMQKLPR